MFECILIGSGFAFAAAVMPGPLQAFLLSSVAQKGWKRTLPASFAPLISDGPVALLVLLVLNRVPESMSRVLQAAGGVFLIYLAWASYRQWRQKTATGPETKGSVPRTLVQAVIVNLLNPNVYLGWSLVLGPAFLNAWHHPANAVALIIAFYATMVAALACTILLFGTTRLLGPSGRRILILTSTIALAALGVYQLMGSWQVRYDRTALQTQGMARSAGETGLNSAESRVCPGWYQPICDCPTYPNRNSRKIIFAGG